MKNIKLRTKLVIIVLVTAIPMIILHSSMIKQQHKRAVEQEIKASQKYAEAIGVAFLNYVNNIWYTELAVGSAFIEKPSLDNDGIRRVLKRCVDEEGTVISYTWVSPKGKNNVISDLMVSKISNTISIAVSKAAIAGDELKGAVVDNNSQGKCFLYKTTFV